MTSTNNHIEIKRPLATYLLGLAQQSPDKEICGLIAQQNNRASTIYPILNCAKNPGTEFEMDAQELIHAQKTMREKDETLFAIFHSHPNSPPELSNKDTDRILSGKAYHDVYHFIISLNTKGVLEMRAYVINNHSVEPVDLSV